VSGRKILTINPVLAHLTRGGIIESFHRGACSIIDCDGTVLKNIGDVAHPIFPRSAIKALQALPLIESGAAAALGYSHQDIALACASHSGEELHIEALQSMLDKSGIEKEHLDCGWHWPMSKKAGQKLAAIGEKPGSLHNNCSGKHIAMLATARHLGEPLENYTKQAHRVQQRVASTVSGFCSYDLLSTTCAIDGCSVPTWAIPLENLSLGFANLARPAERLTRWQDACQQIIRSAKSAPFMVAGSNRFCSDIMISVPRLFAKTGAEGVYCGCVPHAGIGIAVKCDDGAERAAQVIFAAAIAALPVWTKDEKTKLLTYSRVKQKNRNSTITGELFAC